MLSFLKLIELALNKYKMYVVYGNTNAFQILPDHFIILKIHNLESITLNDEFKDECFKQMKYFFMQL